MDANATATLRPINPESLRFAGPPARLDAWLSAQRTELSRARWQDLIKSGHVRVNGVVRKASHALHENDLVEFEVPPPEPVDVVPQDIALDILYEDDAIIVLNKPAGLVVHPAAGHPSGTLVNALLHHCTDLAGVGGEIRPGIVHRLDKDTSGALVVAKNETAMARLAAQFKSHTVQKEYVALVWGHPRPERGTINTRIGRSPHNRKKMSARTESGRPAVTHYEITERFRDVSLLRVRIETGRTHQIRVHLAHIGHPVVGDRQYGRARAAQLPVAPARQLLHAARLGIAHPKTGKPLEFNAPLPEDLREMLRALRG